MKTIEIIGPSGAGKTTYVKDTLNSNHTYHNKEEDVISMFTGGLLFKNIPFIDVFVRNVLIYIPPRHDYNFISKYPGLLETTASIIRNYDDKINILDFIIREAAWFEFFSNKLKENQIYIIDDGLYQIHLRLLATEGWVASDIMDRLPKPDKFIFINSPAEVCLNRQESRERGRASQLEGLSRKKAISKIEKMKVGSREIINEAQNRGIEVEIINNY